ncbi:MAG: hypothetical protein HY271_00385 [Deltaproteobacteria bacterium]|nr:hypothetical protein [Deltaproteobacteria bacterium]
MNRHHTGWLVAVIRSSSAQKSVGARFVQATEFFSFVWHGLPAPSQKVVSYSLIVTDGIVVALTFTSWQSIGPTPPWPKGVLKVAAGAAATQNRSNPTDAQNTLFVTIFLPRHHLLSGLALLGQPQESMSFVVEIR